MTLDHRVFRQTVGQFATGVTVIAMEVDGLVNAMTANSFTSVSLDPMLVLFCVGKHAKTAELVRRATGFSVNILCEDQQALSTYFAGSWNGEPPPHRFVPWAGGPRLERAAAALGCALHEIREGGDHWIVIGRVIALYQEDQPRPPLLFFDGKYHRLSGRATGPAPDLDPDELP